MMDMTTAPRFVFFNQLIATRAVKVMLFSIVFSCGCVCLCLFFCQRYYTL